jgi:hypothetical protein
MAGSEQKRQLADILEGVAQGKLEAINALKLAEECADLPWEKRDVNLAMHTLMKFYIDKDIRETDPDYDEDLKHSLLLHVSRLRGS